MSHASITLTELLADNEASTNKWHAWFTANPDALHASCDIYNSHSVRDFLKHIFAVELRHSQRLTDKNVTAYDAITTASLDDLFAFHTQAVANLRQFLSQAGDTIDESIELQTVSAGTLHASRRKLFAHVLLHSLRHWAQMTTILRQQGWKTDWPKDFLFSEAMK